MNTQARNAAYDTTNARPFDMKLEVVVIPVSDVDRAKQFYSKLGSIEFTKRLLEQAKIAVAPGIGFGDYGDDHVRIALIENELRLRQAARGVRDMFRKDGLLRGAA